MSKIVKSPSYWVMISLFVVSIESSVGLYSMIPLFPVNEMGMDRPWANSLIGFSRVFGIVVLFPVRVDHKAVRPKELHDFLPINHRNFHFAVWSFTRVHADPGHYVLSGCFRGIFISRGLYGSFTSVSLAVAGGRGFPGDARGFFSRGRVPSVGHRALEGALAWGSGRPAWNHEALISSWRGRGPRPPAFHRGGSGLSPSLYPSRPMLLARTARTPRPQQNLHRAPRH